MRYCHGDGATLWTQSPRRSSNVRKKEREQKEEEQREKIEKEPLAPWAVWMFK